LTFKNTKWDAKLRIRVKTVVMILMMVLRANLGDTMLKRGMNQIGAWKRRGLQ
jgi:hypothetical protein